MSVVTIVATAAQLVSTLAGAHAGDVVELAPGTYSNISIYGINVPQTQVAGAPTQVTIESEFAKNPAVLTAFNVENSSGFSFTNLMLSTASTAPASPGGGDTTTPYRVYGSSQITFTGDSILGGPQETYLTDVSGMLIENSTHVIVRNSSFEYLRNGIGQLNNNWLTISSNSFSNLADDGIRGGGTSNVTITGNTFTSQHLDQSDLDHPDAIQFWTTNTASGVSNITITNNTIIRGLGSAVQGIFLNDEVGSNPYTNVLIQGNSITGEQYNGIVVDDGISTKILDNTVVSYPDYVSAIKVLNSLNTVVEGNSAEYYGYSNDTGLVTSSNKINSTVPDPNASAQDVGSQETLAEAEAVPEPTIWAMMLAGISACGGFLRNRRSRLSARV
jgi:hypothetical protein